jgi:hypothetical protein
MLRPTANITQNFMGFLPMLNRRAWYAVSPIAHATFGNNGTAFLLACYIAWKRQRRPLIVVHRGFGGMGKKVIGAGSLSSLLPLTLAKNPDPGRYQNDTDHKMQKR